MTSTDPAARGSLARALAERVVVLDGGLSTELEARGYDVSGDLWSAALLQEAPDAVVAAHRAFVEAGAEVVTTASYQATFEGFAAAGLDADEADRLMRLSVSLARDSGAPWVAASVGPYGALLADGSEYTGTYAHDLGVEGLRAFHRPRLEVLAATGADVLACETVPCLAEAEALVAEVSRLGVPAWLSLTTVTAADGRVTTRLGEDAGRAFALVAGVAEIVAVGLNCTDPVGARAAVEVASTAAPGVPVVVYPNSGELWNGAERSWYGTPDWSPDQVATWTDAGARLVGGCCRVGPAQISTLAAGLRS